MAAKRSAEEGQVEWSEAGFAEALEHQVTCMK